MTAARLAEIRAIADRTTWAEGSALEELLDFIDEEPEAGSPDATNEQNTLAQSVGCPVGVNRVEWMVEEVRQLRAEVKRLLAAFNTSGGEIAILRCNDVRLELLATTPAEAHAAINALFARIEIPVGPMYECERMQAEIGRLTALAAAHTDRLDALRQHLPDLGAQLDSLGPWNAALINVARELAAVPEMSNEIVKLRAEVASLTPKWQEGEPPVDGFYLREDPELLEVVPVNYSQRFGYWYCGNEVEQSWGTAHYSLIPKPTEG